MKCLNCEKDTKNAKYCSKRCSNSVNNSKFPKRKLTKICKSCDNLIKSGRAYCSVCRKNKIELSNKRTIKELIVTNHHRTSAYAKIRDHARNRYNNSLKPKFCVICGYSKALDICHIKPISSFKDTDSIDKVNHINNLIALCKNHHWELDHNLLDKEDKVVLQGFEPCPRI